MGFVLGTEVESMTFTDGGPDYGPAGAAHAVDSESETYRPDAVVGYAVCGTAVRVWPDQAFDPTTDDVHDRCAAVVRGNE